MGWLTGRRIGGACRRNHYGGLTSAWSECRQFSVQVPKLGLRGDWPIWSRGPLAVNEANGNLVVVPLPGPSYTTAAGTISANLTFNALDPSTTTFSGAPGWTLGIGDGTPAKLIDHNALTGSNKFDAVELVSATGNSEYYSHVGTSDTYQSPPGEMSSLVRTSSSGTTTGFLYTSAAGGIYTYGQPGSGGIAPLLSAEVPAAPGAGASADRLQLRQQRPPTDDHRLW